MIKAEIVIQLDAEQQKLIAPLVEKRARLNAGMIIGSVLLGADSCKISLGYIPQKLGEKIRDLAYQELGDQNNVNS